MGTSLVQIGRPLPPCSTAKPRAITALGKQIMKASLGGRSPPLSPPRLMTAPGQRVSDFFHLQLTLGKVKDLTCSHLLKWKPFFLECRLNSMVSHYITFLHLAFHCYCLGKITTKFKVNSPFISCLLGEKYNHAEWSYFKFTPIISKGAFI